MHINRIFIIDDSKMFRTIHTDALRTAGYKNIITAFDNAQEALNEIEELIADGQDELPQVIFLDIEMPGIDGWGFLKMFEDLVLPLPETCKIYMLSSSVDSNAVIRAKNYKSVHGFIPKPLSKESIGTLFNFI